VTERPSAAELLATVGAMVGVEHRRELGYDDPTIDRLLHGLPEIAFPGVTRVYFAAEDVQRRLNEKGER